MSKTWSEVYCYDSELKRGTISLTLQTDNEAL